MERQTGFILVTSWPLEHTITQYFLAFSLCFSFVFYLSTVKEIIILGLSGALIPLQFFPETLQGILFMLPFQAIYHTPLMMLTQPNQPLSVFLPMLAIQVVWAVVLYALTRLFFEQAVKVLRIAGG